MGVKWYDSARRTVGEDRAGKLAGFEGPEDMVV